MNQFADPMVRFSNLHLKFASMYRWYLFSFLLILTLAHCKQPAPEKPDAGRSLPEDFEQFFDKFHSDSLFQLEHIQFPLEGAKQASGTNVDLMIPVTWYADDWIIHKPFDSHQGTFERNYYLIGSVVVEKIKDRGGFFAMERRFARLDGEWTLIYYSVTN
jgi:hypothetical protein